MLFLFYGTDFQGNENKICTLELCCESVKKRLTYMIVCYIISTFLTENPIFWLKNNTALDVRCFYIQTHFLHALRSLRVCFHLPTPVLSVSGYRVQSLCFISANCTVSTPVRNIQFTGNNVIISPKIYFVNTF
jgi:hypothetical protein